MKPVKMFLFASSGPLENVSYAGTCKQQSRILDVCPVFAVPSISLSPPLNMSVIIIFLFFIFASLVNAQF